MKKMLTVFFAVFSFILMSNSAVYSQLNVTLTITDAVVNTTCDDIFSDPDETATVIINGETPVTYQDGSTCYPAFPNTQYQATYICGDDVPMTIQVCFEAFENDPNPFGGNPCEVNPDCSVELCADFPIPPQGDADYTLMIPAGGESDGTLSFTINSTGLPGALNDLPCDAIDAGVLDFGDGMGDLNNSTFNNFCATNDNEPNDFNTTGFFNNNGVWIKFTTSATPGAVHKFTGINDPSMLGDQVSLQIGLFENENNDCTDLTTIGGGMALDGSDFNEVMLAYCLEPSTEYFILIDGDALTGGAFSDSLFGYFGFEIRDLAAISGPDLICDAEALGTVPDGGSVTSPLISNGCATNTNDPIVSGLFNSKGVFLSFQPPATGNVTIDVIADPNGDDAMNTEFAVLSSPNSDCNGPFTKIDVQSFSANASESTTLPCLDPTQTYFILVDGQGASSTRSGIFQVTITDEGENTPIFDQMVTICSDDNLVVGTSIYMQTGMYSDTIILPDGCDSIVNTDLTVLPELIINVDINQPGINQGMANGIATASAMGGTGNNYTYTWSHGETTSMVNNLIGEQNYCVTVEDSNGCMDDTCFIQPLVINLVPVTPNDSLDCKGDTDGVLSISAFAGLPPYQFSWQNADNSLNGNGLLGADFEVATFDNLPAGFYDVQINDSNFDTTVVVQIWEPDAITLDQEDITNNSCFQACDGIIAVNIIGGTPPYLTDWSTGENNTQTISNLCADDYILIVADANNCVATFNFTVTEPDELLVEGMQIQAVSCFEGSDGVASVNVSNGTNVSYLWDNGETTQVISDLQGGVYQVTITNDDGCTAVSSAEVMTPNAPLTVSIQEVAPIICGGSNEGTLEASTTGPGNSIIYEWSAGSAGPFLDELFAGAYSVTATNENGCTATASFNLNEPPEIFAETSVMGVSCYGGLTDGVIFIDTVVGGVPPYEYSATGFGFTDVTELDGLTAGLQTLFVKDDLGCVRPFEIIIPDVPDVRVDLGPDLVLELGDSINLNAMTLVPNLTYTWETTQALSCFDCQKPTIQPTGNTTITVTVFDEESGCEDADDLFIEVIKKRKFFSPNVFSPNSDGINDFFYVQGGADVQLVKSFMVFDRNGGQVFANNNFLPNDFSQGWDGRFKGKNMDAGVFAWFAEVLFLDGQVEVYSGDVTLLK
jgi:gliding motility-associated-like protein